MTGTPDLADLLARARSALEGVTPGPWEPFYHPGGTSYPSDSWNVITARTGDTVAEVDDEIRDYEEPHGEFGRDAQFIAAARQLVPELIAEVERLRRVTDIIDPDSVYREQRDEARTRLAAMEQAVTRVRELHRKLNWETCSECKEDIYDCLCDGGETVIRHVCEECENDWEGERVPHPCPTIRALDGTEAP